VKGRDLLVIGSGLAGICHGVFSPATAGLATPMVLYALMIILFLSFLSIDFKALLRLGGRDLLEVSGWNLAKLILMPVVLWFLTERLVPTWALAVLLLGGASAGVLAPFFAGILGTDVHRPIQIVVTTSLLLPLTLPALVKIIFGAELAIPFIHMARLLGLIVLVPLLTIQTGRRLAPRFMEFIKDHSYAIMLLAIFITNSGVFAPHSEFLKGQSGQVVTAGLIAVLVALSAAGTGLAWGLLTGNRMDAMTGAITFTFSNSILIVVFADKFFGPREILVAALYSFPFLFMLLPLHWLTERLKPEP